VNIHHNSVTDHGLDVAAPNDLALDPADETILYVGAGTPENITNPVAAFLITKLVVASCVLAASFVSPLSVTGRISGIHKLCRSFEFVSRSVGVRLWWWIMRMRNIEANAK
jgi:hypothetical protein